MKQVAILFGIIGLLAGSLLTFLLASNAVNNNMTGMMQVMGMRTSSIDAHFIEQMIPHHEDAITMAKLAQDRGIHPKIKNLAQNIINDQTKEINQMKTWYKQWYGQEVPTNTQVMRTHGMSSGGMHMGMMGNDSDLERLKDASNFDQAFIEEMIPHHQMAVMMANMLKSTISRPEMKQLANNIITSQSREIDQMRQWYKDWGY